MEAKASMKYLRIAPRKVQMVIDMIRGKQVEEALNLLSFTPKRACAPVKKLLLSAVANAKQRGAADVDELIVSRCYVNKGPNLRRFKPRAMGRATRIDKTTSHVHLELSTRI